jgi:hypothetical protein
MVSVPGRLVVPYNTHQHNHGGSESQCGGGCGTTDSDMLRCNGTAVHDAYGRRESLHQREVT